MPTKYNLNPVLKRIIQDFEDAVRNRTLIPFNSRARQEEIDEEYQEAKTHLIDLLGEMDEMINGVLYKKEASPAAKRNRARKKYTRSVQSQVDKNRSVASAKLKRKRKARVGKRK